MWRHRRHCENRSTSNLKGRLCKLNWTLWWKPHVSTTCGSGGVVVTTFQDQINNGHIKFLINATNNILWVCTPGGIFVQHFKQFRPLWKKTVIMTSWWPSRIFYRKWKQHKITQDIHMYIQIKFRTFSFMLLSRCILLTNVGLIRKQCISKQYVGWVGIMILNC